MRLKGYKVGKDVSLYTMLDECHSRRWSMVLCALQRFSRVQEDYSIRRVNGLLLS